MKTITISDIAKRTKLASKRVRAKLRRTDLASRIVGDDATRWVFKATDLPRIVAALKAA